MILYTSDLHFGHTDVIRFDHRPFADREEMDVYLIRNWNERVQPDDDIYIVGDFCHHSDKSPAWYLRQLKGHKHLIIGNHDNPLITNEKALHCLESVEKMEHITDNGKQICLCHFPIAEWNGFFHGSWHIYGHIHNKKNEAYEFMSAKDHALNAGCMINNYAPVSFNELVVNNNRFKESI